MSRFSYHQPNAYSYAVIDPAKFRFAQSPHFRPPTPPVFSPPKDPNAPEEPPKEDKGSEEAEVGAEGEGTKPAEGSEDAQPDDPSPESSKGDGAIEIVEPEVAQAVEDTPDPPPAAPDPPSPDSPSDGGKKKKKKSSGDKKSKTKTDKSGKSKKSKKSASSNDAVEEAGEGKEPEAAPENPEIAIVEEATPPPTAAEVVLEEDGKGSAPAQDAEPTTVEEAEPPPPTTEIVDEAVEDTAPPTAAEKVTAIVEEASDPNPPTDSDPIKAEAQRTTIPIVDPDPTVSTDAPPAEPQEHPAIEIVEESPEVAAPTEPVVDEAPPPQPAASSSKDKPKKDKDKKSAKRSDSKKSEVKKPDSKKKEKSSKKESKKSKKADGVVVDGGTPTEEPQLEPSAEPTVNVAPAEEPEGTASTDVPPPAPAEATAEIAPVEDSPPEKADASAEPPPEHPTDASIETSTHEPSVAQSEFVETSVEGTQGSENVPSDSIPEEPKRVEASAEEPVQDAPSDPPMIPESESKPETQAVDPAKVEAEETAAIEPPVESKDEIEGPNEQEEMGLKEAPDALTAEEVISPTKSEAEHPGANVASHEEIPSPTAVEPVQSEASPVEHGVPGEWPEEKISSDMPEAVDVTASSDTAAESEAHESLASEETLKADVEQAFAEIDKQGESSMPSVGSDLKHEEPAMDQQSKDEGNPELVVIGDETIKNDHESIKNDHESVLIIVAATEEVAATVVGDHCSHIDESTSTDIASAAAVAPAEVAIVDDVPSNVVPVDDAPSDVAPGETEPETGSVEPMNASAADVEKTIEVVEGEDKADESVGAIETSDRAETIERLPESNNHVKDSEILETEQAMPIEEPVVQTSIEPGIEATEALERSTQEEGVPEAAVSLENKANEAAQVDDDVKAEIEEVAMEDEDRDIIAEEAADALYDPPPSPTLHTRRSHGTAREYEHRHKTSSRGSIDGSYSSRRRRESHGSGSTTRSKETDELLAMAKVRKISRRHTARAEGSSSTQERPRSMRSSTIRDSKAFEEQPRTRPRLLDTSKPKSDTGLLLRINKDRKDKDKERAMESPRERREPLPAESSHRRERRHRRHSDVDEEDEARHERRRRRRDSDEAYERANEELRRKRKELDRAQEAAMKARERKKDREKLYHYERQKETSGGTRRLRESITRGFSMLFA